MVYTYVMVSKMLLNVLHIGKIFSTLKIEFKQFDFDKYDIELIVKKDHTVSF